MPSQPWPVKLSYAEAIVRPDAFLSDPELAHASVELTSMGTPKCWSGQFAIVFRLSSDSTSWAVRCFTSPVTDQQSRYAALSRVLDIGGHPDCLVQFHYIDQGILIDGKWYPVVKMEWAEGDTLDRAVERWVASGDTQALNQLSKVWLDVVTVLRDYQIAHGDLQHENILVHQGRIKLVDYDGVYVPALKGLEALELGQIHYQHPLRSRADFNEELDNFSALVIYLSLRALAVDPGLWNRYHDDKRLILSETDYKDPDRSQVIRELLQSPDMEVRKLTVALVEACHGPLDAVASLGSLLGAGAAVQPPSNRPLSSPRPAWVPEPSGQPRPLVLPLPQWLQETSAPTQKAPSGSSPVASKLTPQRKRDQSAPKPTWLDSSNGKTEV